ncbi:hypothetical protein GNP94_07305 [Paenibacillus campinasensis]|uniref:OmpR/PhoB-type domain-containing protein n=1 Tax=Paenibacillus campinasensis TaxID=66347 RepID=A0ABW9SXS4_9BACL|nr:winged helix-turn-helix domain-containing protein [Paenibacillus campinasensis]MUG65815.1 hypothetical protein [Paenibacillus campinasensis]
MHTIHFHLHTYSISCAEHRIELIRKEFELLRYLYEHLQRPRSREQMLDAVWSMETPTDRTVDDHVYRLRKKLQPITHLYTLDTIRGFGYQLSSTQTQARTVITDPHFVDSSEQLLRTYHLYGNSQALDLMLSEHALGIQPPAGIQLSYAFMKGEFQRIITDQTFHFSDKLLFFLYMLLYDESYQEVQHYYEAAMMQNKFSARSMHEAQTLFPLYFYLRTRQFEEARQVMERAEDIITNEEHGFYPFFCNCKLIYGMCTGDPLIAKQQIETLEYFFQRKPYIREKGVYTVLSGIHALLEGERPRGYEKVQEGLALLNQAQIVSHYILSLDILRLFFELGLKEKKLQRSVLEKWRTIIEPYDNPHFKTSIIRQLQSSL